MLIGCVGYAGSGKDTTFERAKRLYPEAERIAFGDLLKEAAAATLGLEPDFLDSFKRDISARVNVRLPDYGTVVDMSLRNFYQRFGTEGHRDVFGTDFWVDVTLPRSFDHSARLVFVTDCRFENEARRVADLGGYLWYINDGMRHVVNHSSEELPLHLIDCEINNTRRDDHFQSLDYALQAELSLLMGLYDG